MTIIFSYDIFKYVFQLLFSNFIFITQKKFIINFMTCGLYESWKKINNNIMIIYPILGTHHCLSLKRKLSIPRIKRCVIYYHPTYNVFYRYYSYAITIETITSRELNIIVRLHCCGYIFVSLLKSLFQTHSLSTHYFTSNRVIYNYIIICIRTRTNRLSKL